jgi:uncharacterized protein YdeI (YjbR/CyaY-like superfamily)
LGPNSSISEGILEFRDIGQWERWLSRNHTVSKGVWIRIFKNGTRVPTVSNSDALDIALCYGWITGQAKSYDEDSWLARFVPRRPRSIWSKINTERAEKLITEGRMKPAGLAQVQEAKRDGRWERAYSPPSRATVPRDFAQELHKNRRAEEFFGTLDKANRYAVIFRIETTKSRTLRKAKIRRMIRMFEKGKKFH